MTRTTQQRKPAGSRTAQTIDSARDPRLPDRRNLRRRRGDGNAEQRPREGIAYSRTPTRSSQPAHPASSCSAETASSTITVTSGLGEVSTKTPIRANDRIRVASLAKTYTATVVLQLVGEGKLRLTDTVERWLPGLVPHGDAISIRQLLNHTSGLADFEYDPTVLAPYLAGDLSHPWAPRRLVQIAVSHPPLFAPGTDESYSSTNYLLAGLIVEARTGHTLGSELNRRIFQPLHLTRHQLPDHRTDAKPARARLPRDQEATRKRRHRPLPVPMGRRGDHLQRCRHRHLLPRAPLRPAALTQSAPRDADDARPEALRHPGAALRPRPDPLLDRLWHRLGPQRRLPRLLHLRPNQQRRSTTGCHRGQRRPRQPPKTTGHEVDSPARKGVLHSA